MADKSESITKLNMGIVTTSSAIEAVLYESAVVLEHGDSVAANRLNESASGLIRRLERIKRVRRGRPREELRSTISYYSAWQSACVGRGELVKSHYENKLGIQLLERSLGIATELSAQNESSHDYAILVKRLRAWLLAARLHKTEPAGF